LTGSAFLYTSNTFSQNTVTPSIFENIIGAWQGSLTYLDYTSNKPYTMPVNLYIEKGKNEYQVKLLLEYPKEPNANSSDKIKITKDGTKINNAKVVLVEKVSENETQITTEYSGKDNNQKAIIRLIYGIGGANLSIQKEVKFENTENWILRNKYNYTR